MLPGSPSNGDQVIRQIANIIRDWATRFGLEESREDSNGERSACGHDSEGNQRILQGPRATSESSCSRLESGSSAEHSFRSDGEDSDGGSSEGGRLLTFPSRRAGEQVGVSRSLVLLELREHEADLAAFSAAYECIRRRVQEVKDEGRLMKLVNWSGTSAVMGSLELTIHAIERVVEELKDILNRIDQGAIPNLDEVIDA